MLAVDTNVVVRYVVRDEAAQTERAQSIFREEKVFISPTVILESEWVLRRVYGFGAKEIVNALQLLCGEPNVAVGEALAVRRALHLTELGLDFADALHLAQAGGCEAFVTFDKELVKGARKLDGVVVRAA